ncbi:MAG: uroporphyrinogen decarboxylase family protein [Kiritimatiellae bacterium]|nr:uroporphyrinogen decarboxylase family protein [Kiritimatiellia bacterium]
MRTFTAFEQTHKIDIEGLLRNLRRQGTPSRVYYMELFYDTEIFRAVDRRFGVTAGLDASAPDYEYRQHIAMQRFLGYETVRTSLLALPTGNGAQADDTTAGAQAREARSWINEHRGMIATWDDFERYPWPDPDTIVFDTRALEWYEKNLPEDMGVVVHGGHFCEYLCWLMGYETLCFALHDDRKLVQAIADRVLALEIKACRTAMQFKRVRLFWGSDDMGFRTGLMISPDDMRHFVLSGHRALARITHDAGNVYLLHACGKRTDIVEDLIEDVKLDALHSWEDNIEKITDAKRAYGERLSLLGGIDVDLLTRGTAAQIRKRVREVTAVCQPGGGFCLGSGNTVANYIPLRNYLTMLDEGRRL